MYLSRKRKEAIAVTAGVVLLLPVVFLGARFVVRSVGSGSRDEVSQPPLPTPPIVTYTDGLTEGRVEDGDTDWVELAAGDELEQRSIVRTGVESFADIRLQTGSVVRLMEETLFSLSSLGTQRIEMDIREGEVVSRLERLVGRQELTLRTPRAVAGVRGTELVVAVDPAGAIVYGMSGSVEVWNPETPEETVRLGVHEKSTVSDGAPSEPIAMSRAEIAHYDRILASLHEQQVLLVSSNITFRPDSAELTHEAEEELRRIYEQLQAVEYDIEIIGHSADVGSRASQIQLSTERARTVLEHLVALGIPASRLSASGAGSSRPIAAGTDPESMSRNRRVEFVVDR